MTFLDKEYRKIITKAVCGRGKKYTKETHSVEADHHPSSVLGCWVINHLYNAKKKSKDSVEINGSYDINIWYSYNDNTKTDVVTERVSYRDIVPLSIKDEHCMDNEFDVIAKVVQQPNCLECKISKKGKKIGVEVERAFVVQVIGETQLYVKVDPRGHSLFDDEDDDDWSIELTDDELSEVNPDFVEKQHTKD